MTIGETWGSVRSILKDHFSFSQTKDLVGAAGLPIYQLAHVKQGLGGKSKGDLLDYIDGLFLALDDPAKNRFVTACVEELLKRNPTTKEPLEEVLARVGYGLKERFVFPLRLQIDLEAVHLSEGVNNAITKCVKRYRDGDFDGAITAICGVVDSFTEQIYNEKALGDHKEAKYQERVSCSFQSNEMAYTAPLKGKGMSDQEVDRVWHNHKKAVAQAAYVLAAFRREYSDVHGEKQPPAQFVQKAMDCAIFILRSFTSIETQS